MAIHFYDIGEPVRLKNKMALKYYLTNLFKVERVELQALTYVFCSDEYLLEINQEFLQHDDYTDIITFSLGDEGAPVVGEIYISTDRVKENSFQLATMFHVELHRVIFHGALHLCGYSDKNTDEKKRMREKEDFYLKNFGLLQ